jgi:demethylmacrocin O-methyltransferase
LRKNLGFLEIGVGGYENDEKGYANSSLGGESLRFWKDYFPHTTIFGIDIQDKSALQEDRIVILQGSQTDEDFLARVVKRIGSLDIVIDDGSHINSHVIQTFRFLFPLLNDGGIYVIEDTQTSYWPTDGYGGDSRNLNNPGTMMGFFKCLVDGLNHAEFDLEHYTPTYFDQHIVSVHFYHNLIFIYKGQNDCPSNRKRN